MIAIIIAYTSHLPTKWDDNGAKKPIFWQMKQLWQHQSWICIKYLMNSDFNPFSAIFWKLGCSNFWESNVMFGYGVTYVTKSLNPKPQIPRKKMQFTYKQRSSLSSVALWLQATTLERRTKSSLHASMWSTKLSQNP